MDRCPRPWKVVEQPLFSPGTPPPVPYLVPLQLDWLHELGLANLVVTS